MTKKITLVLEDHRTKVLREDKPFKVHSVTNSIEFRVGEYLAVPEVQDILNNRRLEIDVKLIEPK